jgi:hypothetical protein
MIPGVIISILTFPGIIVHELAHQLFCRWLKVPVFEVCYFQAEDPAGFVLHERPDSAYKNVLISIGPVFVNTILGCLIAFPAALNHKLEIMGPLDYVLFYLGISIAMHAFPSTGDASSLWQGVIHSPNTSIGLKILAAPLVGAIYLGALGSIFWLDLIYGVAVAVGLPWVIIQAIA